MAFEERKGKELWLPTEPGTEIIGEITNIDLAGDYGTKYELKTPEGLEVRLPQHKVLQDRLEGVRKGAVVKIIFEREDPPTKKGNNPTKIYKVFEDR